MTEVQTTGVSRRRIIQGAAWATPAIVIAAAAPAAASSLTPEVFVTASQTSTSINGQVRTDVPASFSGAQFGPITIVMSFPPGAGNNDPWVSGPLGWSHNWDKSGSPKTLTVITTVTISGNGQFSWPTGELQLSHFPSSMFVMGNLAGYGTVSSPSINL